MLETSGLWVAHLRLEDPPGLSPITTVGRFATVEAAQMATDEVWASRQRARRRYAKTAAGPRPGSRLPAR